MHYPSAKKLEKLNTSISPTTRLEPMLVQSAHGLTLEPVFTKLTHCKHLVTVDLRNTEIGSSEQKSLVEAYANIYFIF